MPPKTLAKVGLIALVLALLLPWSYSYWLKTRTFKLVDKQVLLETGRVRTEEFEINLREEYLVQLEVHYVSDHWVEEEQKCPFRWWGATDWRVYRQSGGDKEKRELWASSDEIVKRGGFPTGFNGSPGKYRMEWNLSASQECLNGRQARLSVYTDSLAYEEFGGFLGFVCVFMAGTGILLLLRAIGAWVLGYSIDKHPPRIFPEMELRNSIPRQRHRPIPCFKSLPNFGLIHGFVLWVLLFLFMIIIPPTSVGLWVDFREQKAVGVEKSPWTETVSVYVDGQRRFLVNGQPVLGDELKAKLEQELSKQMVWTVYLEADSDCLFMDVVHAMDTIQGLGAKLVWITPKTREEWKQKSIR
jgi:biopolymer transport protein ExbD